MSRNCQTLFFFFLVLFCSGLGLSLPIYPFPADKVVVLKKDSPQIFKIPHIQAVAVENSILVPEILKFEEVMLTPKEEGSADLYLLIEDGLAVWRILVGRDASEYNLMGLNRGLPRFKGCTEANGQFNCGITSMAQYAKLKAWIQAHFLTKEKLAVSYAAKVIMDLLARISDRLKQQQLPDIKVYFLGANIIAEGEVAGKDEVLIVLKSIYEHFIGNIIIENRLKIKKR